jgi:hypothetical protein
MLAQGTPPTPILALLHHSPYKITVICVLSVLSLDCELLEGRKNITVLRINSMYSIHGLKPHYHPI